jgi:hypothetical protein
MSVKLSFNTSLPSEDRDVVSKKSREMLIASAERSNNNEVVITSTIRRPQRQAQIMYDNLENGVTIRYKEPGREVINVYRAQKDKGAAREDIIRKMEAKIIELGMKGSRVSLHCVTEEQYGQLNVIDISFRNFKNPRDFVKELIKFEDLKKVITPFSSDYDSKKVSVDSSEPAIHIEINQ